MMDILPIFWTFDQVRSNLKNLLLTKKGERILQPEFGSGLHDLLFNPATEKFEEDLETTINDSVSYVATPMLL